MSTLNSAMVVTGGIHMYVGVAVIVSSNGTEE
jgi:hypothetical protein